MVVYISLYYYIAMQLFFIIIYSSFINWSETFALPLCQCLHRMVFIQYFRGHKLYSVQKCTDLKWYFNFTLLYLTNCHSFIKQYVCQLRQNHFKIHWSHLYYWCRFMYILLIINFVPATLCVHKSNIVALQ